jgi:Putative auto-transporter adhesin, head GIN domain
MAITSAPHRGGHAEQRNRLPLIVGLAAVLILATVGVALLVNASGSSSSALRGSGIGATQIRSVGAFSGVDLAGSNTVTVVVGVPRSVVVDADSNLLSHVTTQVTAGTLVIGTTGSFSTSSPMSVQVNVPSLTVLKLSGSGQISVIGIKASRLDVTLSGSGMLTAAGTATQLYVTLDGSGEARLYQLTADDAHAVVSGSGLIEVTATTSLDAAVPGSGAVFYQGNPPRVTSSVTGSGAVMHG